MSSILVVDDDLQMREMLQTLLEEENHRVTTADDGTKALHMFQSHPADLVIMDLIMPGQEGIETIMKIKQISPQTPIIAMSGGGINTPDVYLANAEVLGADRSLHKPFTRNDILHLLAELLPEKPPS